jgi:hypothetical protein
MRAARSAENCWPTPAGLFTLYGGLRDGVFGGPFVADFDASLNYVAARGYPDQAGAGWAFRGGAYAPGSRLWLAGNADDSGNFAGGLLYARDAQGGWVERIAGPSNADNALTGLALGPAGGLLVVGYDTTGGSTFTSDTRFSNDLTLTASDPAYTAATDMTQTVQSSASSSPVVSQPDPHTGAVFYTFYEALDVT